MLLNVHKSGGLLGMRERERESLLCQAPIACIQNSYLSVMLWCTSVRLLRALPTEVSQFISKIQVCQLNEVLFQHQVVKA